MDRAELSRQRDYAALLLRMGKHRGPLRLFHVVWPSDATTQGRVSIVGGTILDCAPDLWRARGADVIELERVSSAPDGSIVVEVV